MAKKPQAPVPQAPQAPPQYQCGDCGHSECITQLRSVKYTIGWDRFQVFGVAPVQMCTKCGKLTVTHKIEIGKMAGLVSEADARKAAKAAGLVGEAENGGSTNQSSQQIQAAIDNLKEMKERALEQEKEKKRKDAKAKREKAKAKRDLAETADALAAFDDPDDKLALEQEKKRKAAKAKKAKAKKAKATKKRPKK